jgi:hypothetical protein
MFLGETPDNPPRFVSRERTVGVELMLVHPLAGDNVSTGWRRDKLPGRVLDESGEFRAHGVGPVRIVESRSVVRRDRRGRSEGAKVKEALRFEDAVLCTSAHGMGGKGHGSNERFGRGRRWSERRWGGVGWRGLRSSRSGRGRVW